ncbi:MAG TPA: nucleotidyltransferase domain-containing protein, partial [Draconibacterium sp.]|nr:nucleotidyltransferase domain-containing protein [Draconibacterium sp.]
MKIEAKLGISTKSFQLLLNALSEFSSIETACIYGSRAIGNYKKGSDIDLVLFGKSITQKVLLD